MGKRNYDLGDISDEEYIKRYFAEIVGIEPSEQQIIMAQNCLAIGDL